MVQRKFSKTESLGKMLVIWKLRDRPRRLISNGCSPSMGSPCRRTSPEVGRKRPLVRLKQGRFAGAVRADDRMSLAARDLERDAADDLGRAEALAQVEQREGGGHAGRPNARRSFTTPQASPTRGQSSRRDATPAPNSRSATIQGRAVAESTSKPKRRITEPSLCTCWKWRLANSISMIAPTQAAASAGATRA